MKNIFKITTLFWILGLILSCGTQSNISPEQVKNLVQHGQFTFVAQRANPTNYDVINVMNSIPNGGSARMLTLDQGYSVELKENELTVTLPYFGRMYTSSMQRDNSYRFTSKDFSVNKSEGRKNSTVFILIPNDQKNISRINVEVFSTGKSYVSINSNDRQPISYDGYITANQPLKK